MTDPTDSGQPAEKTRLRVAIAAFSDTGARRKFQLGLKARRTLAVLGLVALLGALWLGWVLGGFTARL